MKKRTSFWNKPIVRLALGLAASAIFLYLAFRDIALRDVWLVLRQASLFWIGMALISVAANTIFKVYRWQVLMRPAEKQVGFLPLMGGLLSGQMLNTVLPVRIGDLQRAYVVGGLGPGRTFTFGTILVEKILDLIWYALIMLLLFTVIPLPGWINNSALWLGISAFLLTTAAFLIAYHRGRVLSAANWILQRLPERFAGYLAPRLQSGLKSLDVLQSRSDLIKVSLWSAAIWGTALLTNYLAGLAFGLRLPWSAYLLLLVGLQAGISLANIPGRIGIFEYICVLVLTLYGVEPALALGYGILLHAIVFIPTIFAGMVSFWAMGMKPSNPAEI